MIYVLYHGNCYDGFGAAWAARKALGDELRDLGPKYIPVTHGRPMPEMVDGARVYILDFSYPRAELLALAKRMSRVVVLDHHKTAEEALRGLAARSLAVTFDMEKSGAILAWEHFFTGPAPDLLRYIEDRDLWRFSLHESEEVAAAMRSWPFKFDVWDRLEVGQLASDGVAILRQTNQMVQMICSQAAMGECAGVPCVVVNATAFWSEVGHRLLQDWPESPFAASWYRDKHGDTIWSLRGRGDFDVSALAKSQGGGGHRDAAGFTVRMAREEATA